LIKIKRFIVLVFAALTLSDICSYIKYAITNNSLKITNYYGVYSKMGSCVRIYNLATIYFFGVCILYFIFNFFKTER